MTLASRIRTSKIVLTLKSVTSGASRKSYVYKSDLPLQLRHKKLLNLYRWASGRGASGRVVVWTKGKRTTKHRVPSINYKFRLTCVGFIGGFMLKPTTNKLISLLFTSTGSATYVPTTNAHKLFELTQLRSAFYKRNKTAVQLQFTNKGILISQSFFLVKQLPKNQPVSLLELAPNQGIQYVRGTGTSAKILKMDSRVSTSLIKLPSGVKKVFSTFSLGSVGPVALPENKKWSNRSAGFYKKFGRKSQVRGVAMNPVDHPHGGRAKAIRYQRTPWGKTTKYK